MGNKRGTEVLKFGMGEFDRNESKQSRNNICADLQKKFQNIFVNNLTWLVFRTQLTKIVLFYFIILNLGTRRGFSTHVILVDKICIWFYIFLLL